MTLTTSPHPASTTKRLTPPLVLSLALAALLAISCTHAPTTVAVNGTFLEVTSALDSIPQNAEAQAILDEYRQRVIDVQAPVLGTAATIIERGRPEGLMNNFEADVLRAAGEEAEGKPVAVAVANYGGIRNLWLKGDITVGDVYRAFPFENCLALATLSGEQLTRLFKAIAHVGGQPISGAALVITPDGELVTCDVQGHPVDPSAHYRVATLDYLVEGNDGMDVFSEATDVTVYPELTIRDLISRRIQTLTSQHKAVAPVLDGRITVIDVN